MSAHKFLQKYDLMLLAIVTMAFVITLYWQSFSRLVGMWSISYYEYGWLVYPASLYVLFRKRDELASIKPQTSKLGVLLLVLVVLAWTVASVAGVQVVEFIAATLLVFTAFWAIAGSEAMRKTAFPLLLLLAAVPITEFLIEPLMKVTAGISEVLLALAGVPALRDGQFFYLEGGSFEVADVCSGLKYLLAAVFAGLAFSYVTYTTNSKRLVFLVFVAIVIVVTNGVRAFVVMSVASATNMEILGGKGHVVFGMFLFALVFGALIWIGEKYADPQSQTGSSVRTQSVSNRGAVSLGTVFVPVLILLAGPPLDAATQNRAAVTINNYPLPNLSGCEKRDASLSYGEPLFVNADLESRASYSCGEFSVSVYLASYGSQRQGEELVSSENRIWPSEWSSYVRENTVYIRAGTSLVGVREVLVNHPLSLRLTWYWYQVGTSISSKPMHVKFLETIKVLTLQPVESSIVVVTVTGGDLGDLSSLEEVLETHVNQLIDWNLERVELEVTR